MRLAVKVGGAMIVGLALAGGLAFARGRAAPVSARGGAQAQSELWHGEIELEVKGGLCPSRSSPERQVDFVAQTLVLLEGWRERELVDSSQPLRSWKQIEQARRCALLVQDLEAEKALRQESQRLSLLMAHKLRVWHAAYLRAEKSGRDAEAHAAVRALLQLVEAHSGSFVLTLRRAERRLKKKQGS